MTAERSWQGIPITECRQCGHYEPFFAKGIGVLRESLCTKLNQPVAGGKPPRPNCPLADHPGVGNPNPVKFRGVNLNQMRSMPSRAKNQPVKPPVSKLPFTPGVMK